MSRAQDVTALVSSRICHDLISPIGAIGNGVELLSQLGDPGTPELGLIGDSVNSASEKLRLFRIAFGRAEPGARIALTELQAASAATFTGRASVGLTLETGAPDLPRLTAKALMLALLCQEKCLPRGGTTAVTVQEDGFAIATEAPRLRDAAPLWALVEGAAPEADIAPSEVQFLLLGELLRASGAAFTLQTEEERLEIALSGLATAVPEPDLTP